LKGGRHCWWTVPPTTPCQWPPYHKLHLLKSLDSY
jgi:hypothetical protein